MLFSQFCPLRRLVFDQSSPVPPFHQGGSPERDGGVVVGVGVGVVAAQHFLFLIKDFFTKESVYSNPLTLRCVLSFSLVLVGLL